MKNVKKMLTQHKSEILPDEKIKDNVRHELGFDGAQYSAAYAHGGERTADVRRNKIIVLCAAALVVALLLGTIVPALMKNKKPITPSVSNKFARFPFTLTARLPSDLCWILPMPCRPFANFPLRRKPKKTGLRRLIGICRSLRVY